MIQLTNMATYPSSTRTKLMEGVCTPLTRTFSDPRHDFAAEFTFHSPPRPTVSSNLKTACERVSPHMYNSLNILDEWNVSSYSVNSLFSGEITPYTATTYKTKTKCDVTSDETMNRRHDRPLHRSVSCQPSAPNSSVRRVPRVCSSSSLLSDKNTVDFKHTSVWKEDFHSVNDSGVSNYAYRASVHLHKPRHHQSSYNDDTHYNGYTSDCSSVPKGYRDATCNNGKSESYISDGYVKYCGSLHDGNLLTRGSALRVQTSSADTLYTPSVDSLRGVVQRRRSVNTLQTVVENIPQNHNPPILESPMFTIGNSSTSGFSSSIIRHNSIPAGTSPNGSDSNVHTFTDNRGVLKGILISTRNESVESKGIPTAIHNTIIKRDSIARFPFAISRRSRSKSLPDLQADSDSTNNASCYSDDEDGDHFGFLNYPSLVSRSTVMHKPKVTPSHNLLPRRWRTKIKKTGGASSQLVQPMWSPEGCFTWCSVSGRKVTLKPVNILNLSEAERLVLQKIALTKLQSLSLGCPIVIPKENDVTQQRQKKRALSVKRRSKSANLSSLLDTLSSDKSRDKDNRDMRPSGLVFGIPLALCIANDRELAAVRARAQSALSDSTERLSSPLHKRRSSSSSQGSHDNIINNDMVVTAQENFFAESAKRTASSDSLSEPENGRQPNSIQNRKSRSSSQAVGSTPNVPRIVDACFKHLETYGMNTLGIFRISSSRKRVKQLREEFDSGNNVQLTEEHSPHDVGGLLKEFFRDLPEPLLTRDLYLPLVTTRKIEDKEIRTEAVRLLLTLLPPVNRDTLWSLLRFLAAVSKHSSDATDSSGNEIPGNKMDSHNLATLFGPNLLHRVTSVNEKQFLVECTEQAEQNSEVISVIKDLIDNHYDLFEISAAIRDEILCLMMEADPENMDRVLRHLDHEYKIEPDPESTSSVFEECEGQRSLQRSANSDADLLGLERRKSVSHAPLRITRSADPWTDPPHPTVSVSPRAEYRRMSSVDSVSDLMCQTPSPQDSPSVSRSPQVGLSRLPLINVCQDNPLAKVHYRSTLPSKCKGPEPGTPVSSRTWGSVTRERPHSESYIGSLYHVYSPENNVSLVATTDICARAARPQHIESDISTDNQVLPTNSQRKDNGKSSTVSNNSLTRKDNGKNSTVSNNSHDRVGSTEWQRERWKHWEEITTDQNGGKEFEQETLV